MLMSALSGMVAGEPVGEVGSKSPEMPLAM
jgi:hypothetical protein